MMRNAGWSLLEVWVVLALMLIVAHALTAAYGHWQLQQAERLDIERLTSMLNTARTFALTSQHDIEVCGEQSDWSRGIVIHGNNGPLLRLHWQGKLKLNWQGWRHAKCLRFGGQGVADNGSLCYRRQFGSTHCFILNRAGRLRLQRTLPKPVWS